MKFCCALLLAIIPSLCFSQTTKAGNSRTSGPCSPAISGNNNTVNIPGCNSESNDVLTPANDPMPKLCGGDEVPSNETRIYGGGNMAIVNPDIPYGLVMIAGQPLLSITTTKRGILISGTIYSEDGALFVIKNNRFEVNKNLGFKPGHPDRHTLIIYDNWHREAFYIRFLNPHAIKMRGTFFYPGHVPVLVGDDSIKVGAATISESCNLSPHYPAFIGVR